MAGDGVAVVEAPPGPTVTPEDWDRFSYAAFQVAAARDMIRWRGIEIAKLPTDCWRYQELLTATRPDLIIETGTWRGGSARFLADCCTLLGHGQVVTIDVGRAPDFEETPGVTYFVGWASIDPPLLAQVRALAYGQRTMVILDSDHDAAYVAQELEAYAPLVSPGCALIVEDTHFEASPFREPGTGPLSAVTAFLAHHHEFVAEAEHFQLTLNRGGYLRRLAIAA